MAVTYIAKIGELRIQKTKKYIFKKIEIEKLLIKITCRSIVNIQDGVFKCRYLNISVINGHMKNFRGQCLQMHMQWQMTFFLEGIFFLDFKILIVVQMESYIF